MHAITIGLDLAKSVFQVHGEDAKGKIVFQKKLRRAQLEAFFGKQPRCAVGMEACGSAHYWGRTLRALGHEVRLDSGGLCEAVRSAQQDRRARCGGDLRGDGARRHALRRRSRASSNRRCVRSSAGASFWSNSGPSFRTAFAVCSPRWGSSRRKAGWALPNCESWCEAGDARAPGPLKTTLEALGRQIDSLAKDIDGLEAQIMAAAKENPDMRRLCAIPGIGGVTAHAIVVGDRRRKALQFGARFRRLGGTDAAREFERGQDHEARHQPAGRAAAALAAALWAPARSCAALAPIRAAPPSGSAASSLVARSRSPCWRRPPRPPGSPGLS